MNASLSSRFDGLRKRFLLIEDAHERLAAVVDRIKKLPPLPPEHRCDAFRVKGCISKVWLVPSLRDGLCYFQVDAESPLIRGVATLLCEPFNGATPQEILAHEGDLLGDLQITQQLSDTRRTGMEHLLKAIRAFAQSVSAAHGVHGVHP